MNVYPEEVAQRLVRISAKGAHYKVNCQDCPASTGFADSEFKAWAQWNRRVGN